MKKRILLITALLTSVLTIQATVLTVNNNVFNPNNVVPGQFDLLQDAIDFASLGDTIYISGSPANYGVVIISKPKLTLIGAGYNPDNQFGNKTSLLGVILRKDIVNNIHPHSTTLIGLTISGNLSAENFVEADTVLVERCRIVSKIRVSNFSDNWIIRNNIIGNMDLQNAPDILITNNIIQGTIRTSNKASVTISNNVFHHPSIAFNAFVTISNTLVTNNIFFQTNPQTCSFCTFNNNISFPSGDFLVGTNMGGGNLVAVDPEFVGLVNLNSFVFDNDYTLLVSSPGINAGTDGTDIGITGGVSPFTVDDKKMPAIPQISHMEILNATIPLNDVLQIHIQAEKQD